MHLRYKVPSNFYKLWLVLARLTETNPQPLKNGTLLHQGKEIGMTKWRVEKKMGKENCAAIRPTPRLPGVETCPLCDSAVIRRQFATTQSNFKRPIKN